MLVLVEVECTDWTTDTRCVQLQSGRRSQGVSHLSLSKILVAGLDWRLRAAADDDERLASLQPGDQGLDSGPGPALPTTGQKPETTN